MAFDYVSLAIELGWAERAGAWGGWRSEVGPRGAWCVLLWGFHSAPTYANTLGIGALFVEVRRVVSW